MMDIAPVLAAIRREYPSPRVDPAWVQACVQLLLDHGQDPTPYAVIEQYLHSDLSHTSLPSGLIPGQAHNIHLFPQRTLLQIISLTEIAASAFQLQTVLEQRRDVLDGASRIRRMDDEDTEDEEVGEGKLPSYPRGMLRLELTDGERVIKGIEYRRIEGLVLGETALGCKLVVQNVRTLRGTLLLDSKNTQVLGRQVDHLEAEQPTQFVEDLRKRLGKPAPGQVPASASATAGNSAQGGPGPAAEPTRRLTMVSRPRAAVARAQVATPTGAVTTSAAENLPIMAMVTAGPSRAAPAPIHPRFPSDSPPPIIRPTPTRPSDSARSQARRRATAHDDSPAIAGPSSSRPKRAAGATAVANIKHLYEALPPDLDAESEELELETPSLRARGGARRTANTNTNANANTRQEVIVIDDDYTADTTDFWDVDDSFIRQIDEVEARAVSAVSSGRERAHQHYSGGGDGDGRTRGKRNVERVYDLSSEFDLNEAALRDLEAIEARASGQNGASSGREILELEEEEEFGWEGDDSFVRHVEAVESRVSRKETSAAHQTYHGRRRDTKTNTTMPSSGTRGPQLGNRKRRIIMESDDEGGDGGKEYRPEVIVIDD